jgi:hypothetical protein
MSESNFSLPSRRGENKLNNVKGKGEEEDENFGGQKMEFQGRLS